MKLGDNPEIRRQLGGGAVSNDSDGTRCPECGGSKKPEFELCYACSQKQGGGGRAPSGSNARNPEQTPKLASDCVFESFYGENGKLRPQLFFQAPQKLASDLHKAGLTPHALRLLYQGFFGFAAPLRDNRLDFATAQERFGVFYVERVVRQTQRGMLPPLMKSLIDSHRDVALRNREEMLGLFRYLTNLLCYFGDQAKKG